MTRKLAITVRTIRFDFLLPYSVNRLFNGINPERYKRGDMHSSSDGLAPSSGLDLRHRPAKGWYLDITIVTRNFVRPFLAGVARDSQQRPLHRGVPNERQGRLNHCSVIKVFTDLRPLLGPCLHRQASEASRQ